MMRAQVGLSTDRGICICKRFAAGAPRSAGRASGAGASPRSRRSCLDAGPSEAAVRRRSAGSAGRVGAPFAWNRAAVCAGDPASAGRGQGRWPYGLSGKYLARWVLTAAMKPVAAAASNRTRPPAVAGLRRDYRGYRGGDPRAHGTIFWGDETWSCARWTTSRWPRLTRREAGRRWSGSVTRRAEAEPDLCSGATAAHCVWMARPYGAT